MALETRLRRTTGTIYGEFMEDSGISLPNGTYITRGDFISELIRNGVTGNRAKLSKNIKYSILDYGGKDNVWTGVQVLETVSQGRWYDSPLTKYTSNQWKELMSGNYIKDFNFYEITYRDTLYKKQSDIFRGMRQNPQEGVRGVKEMYTLFTQLPQSLQEEFFGILESFPCNLDFMMDTPNIKTIKFFGLDSTYPIVNDVVSKIMDETGEDHRNDMAYVLRLVSKHNICVGKGKLIKRQIEYLVGYDISKIPTEWKQGHLEKTELTDERIAVLNTMLFKKLKGDS